MTNKTTRETLGSPSTVKEGVTGKDAYHLTSLSDTPIEQLTPQRPSGALGHWGPRPKNPVTVTRVHDWHAPHTTGGRARRGGPQHLRHRSHRSMDMGAVLTNWRTMTRHSPTPVKPNPSKRAGRSRTLLEWLPAPLYRAPTANRVTELIFGPVYGSALVPTGGAVDPLHHPPSLTRAGFAGVPPCHGPPPQLAHLLGPHTGETWLKARATPGLRPVWTAPLGDGLQGRFRPGADAGTRPPPLPAFSPPIAMTSGLPGP